MWSLLLLLFCHASVSLSSVAPQSPSASDSVNELRFLYDSYNATIQENSRPRTYVGSRRLMGVPLDNLPLSAQIRFSITDGNADGFFTAESEEIGDMSVLQIRTKTGMNDVLNRERKSIYFLTVKGEVRNHHKSYSTFVSTSVRIEVLDINDNIPLFYEDFYDVSVGEDSNVHTPLVTVSAEDADIGANGKVYYSLLNPKNDYFCVHPTSGVVSLTRTLDSSVKGQHKIVIVAEDRGVKLDNNNPKSRASKATVNVNVLKVNLYSPKLNINHLPHIIEHAHIHIYAIITITDRDVGRNGRIKSVDIISGNPNHLFSIVKGSKVGEYNLAVLKLLDRELAPVGYNLTIRATDDGKPSRASVANIHVNIADINDQAPVFLKEQYDEAVSEESPPHTAVVRVAASDIDQGNNGKVLFRILAGNENDKFAINPHTGLISTKDWLDAETTAYYSLAVAAVDQASNAQRKQSSAKVVIRVLDGNDNAPQFNIPNTEVSIDENEPTGSYVTRVSASDVDSGENGFVSFSIANLDQVPFTIDPFDGTIRTSSILDFEAERRIYTIKVRASDWGQPLKQETETTVKVKVRDVNDNRPVFVENICSGWIDIDSAIGSTIVKFRAIDLDEGDVVYYRLEESDLDECWSLDTSTGVLSLGCKLSDKISREKKKTLIINITATDGRHISDKASLSLALVDKEQDIMNFNNPNNARVACEETNILKKQLEIENSAREHNEAVETFALFPPRYGYNSHAPEFPPKFPDTIDLVENVEVGYEVLKVDATDHDRGYNGRIVYSIASGDNDSVFEIDTFTGYIYVAAPIDREKTEKYVLNITLYDLGVPHKMSSRNITINIIDINDNAPEFTQLSYSLHLPENTRNGTSVAHIVAEDPDLGQNGLVTYELVTKLKDFTLDPSSGVLYVSSYLDRESRENYDLRVRAWDNALDGQKFSLARVLVTILDINDCAPDFGAAKEIKISVPEDYPVGAVIVSLQASDKDLGEGGRVTYSFLSGAGSKFRVDPETGIVRIAAPLDFESRQFYNITVKAEDAGYPVLSSTANLLIQVSNVDENLGPPVLTKRVIRASVSENEPPGTFVTLIEADDPDGGEISYAVVGGSGKGVFSITKKGEIRTLRRLDRETKKGYWLTITVSDDGTVPLTDTCHVYVEVLDVNDHLPQSEIPVYRPTVKEDAPTGTTVVILKASDGDLAPSNVTYFISRSRRRRNGWMLSHPEGEEDAQEVFGISKETGVLRTTAGLDRERQSEYDIWVGVTDGQRTSLTPVFVVVSDVNDNAPRFLEKVYRFNIPSREKSKVQKRQPLFRVFAHDKDVSRNADIRYSVRTRKGKSRFKIDESTGYIFCSKSLVPGQTFDLTVKATDNGFPQLSSTAHVIIRVVEIPLTSSNPPTIDIPATAHVMETDPVGHVVAFINAFDLDNDTLWYSIEDGNDGYHFSIGLDSGLLSLAKELDREKQNVYKLSIAVTDGVHTTRTKLTVRVMDFNDHRPMFSRPLYETAVSESTKVGTTLLILKCHDRDSLSSKTVPLSSSSSSSVSLPSSSLFFSIHHTESVESESLFTLDPITGELLLAQPLNREVMSSHLLTVSCQDRGGIQREDLARVEITVKDANDNPPFFLESTIEAQVSEGATPGTVIARVIAVDEDEGESGRISYSIVEGNQGATFAIDSELGHIILVEPLLQTKTKEFLLLVRAMDHAHKPKSSSIPVRILIKPSLDVPPTWDGTSFPRVIELSEWTSPNTVIAIVAASSPPSLMYEIESGNTVEETFTVSPSSGVLTLNYPLDFEVLNFYNITIKATNSVGRSRYTWCTIRVLDENDWAPEWESLNYDGTVLETAEIGSAVLESNYRPKPLTVKATDKDTGRNGRVTYSIVDKDIGNFFSIDEYTGAIRVAGRLQEIGGQTVELRIWARDSGIPRRECIAPSSVSIYVKKVITNELAFESELYETEVYLPTVSGVKVTCVALSDSRAQARSHERHIQRPIKPIQYVIGGDKQKHFRIDSNNGCIYIANHIDLNPYYNLTVNASTASTKVVVRVRELPKGALKFTQEVYYANVLENSTKEVNLLVVGVKGLPINSHVKYSLLNSNEFFEIRPTSGVLRTVGKSFDWEKQNHYSLIVRAHEIENEESFGHVVVNVAVLDVNDNEPVFVGQPYDALVSTSAERGHVIAKVRALDADSGAYGEVRYELVRGSGELFYVDKKNGEISLKQSLSDPHKTLSLTVAAYDGGKQPLSSQALVIIRVVAAEGPLFEQLLYKVDLPENTQVGNAVIRVEARSSAGNDIIYSIISGNQNSLFDLDYETGVIRVTTRLNYELRTNHNLTVRALDPISELHSDTHVTVNVIDVNDNPPHFQKIKFFGEVSEAAPIGHTILKVQAYDEDTGLGGIIRYSCYESCANFTIDPETGYIILNSILDAELKNVYSFSVVAKDQGLPSLTAKATVIIKVIDFNDNAPVWSQDTYTSQVSTEARPGHVVTTLSVFDPDISNSDGDRLSYHIISGDPQSLFYIEPNDGVVSVTAPHKLVGGSKIILNISASDGVHISFTSLLVNIHPANDNAPKFVKPLFESAVEENSAPGQFVIQVEATDDDGGHYGTIQYQILGQEKDKKFSVDEKGKIYTEISLDREACSFHEIVVAARDSGGKVDFAKVRIYVKDKNDHSPLFTLPQYQANIPVDTPPVTAILKVTAEDADEGSNSRVTYQLYEDDNADALKLFSIDVDTGELILNVEVSEKENEVFQFFIRATDGGVPPLHSDVPVTIFLISAHERPPFCPRKYAQFFLSEDDPLGTVVTSLWRSENSQITYSLTNGESSIQSVSSSDSENREEYPAAMPFGLSPSSEVIVEGQLDHEVKRVHTVTVVNQTLSTPPLVDYMTISIVVMDVNDCVPEFSSPFYDFTVAENTKPGSVVAHLTAVDKDDGNNGQIQYSFKNTTNSWLKSVLSVDPHTGSVTLISSLDREANDSISFVVVATDNGPNPLSSEAVINLYIEDYNDNTPVFSRDIYYTNVPEDTDIGMVIVELALQDQDVNESPLDFFVMGNDDGGKFLVHTSGQVYVARPLDRETRDHYTLVVTATDGKFSANTTVSVNVIDVNDNGPECKENVFRRSVGEDAPVGSHVVSISYYDPDEGANARSRFNLIGDGAKDFNVDQQTGKVVVGRRLDRETQDSYELLVSVEDWEVSEWRCESSLFITITDVNDNPPRFLHETFTVFVSEDAAVNSVLTKMVATDSDIGINRRLKYSLTDSADGAFSIDSTEGVVTLLEGLDREKQDTYTVVVEAKDMGKPSFSSSAVLTIIVTDVNDNPPEFVRTLQQVTVPENSPIGTEISRVMATSKDIGVNAEISYSLEHATDEEYLLIHPKTGVISIKSPLDYEAVQLLVVTVIAVDGGSPPLSATALINVTVTDVNDNGPVFTRPTYEVTVPEDLQIGRSLAQVSANDLDCGKNGEISFAITDGNDDEKFSIASDTGIVSLINFLDRETISEYVLEITGKDKGSPSNSASALVKIQVSDVNDNPPQFIEMNYTAIVQENRPVGYKVFGFLVTDADGEPNGHPFTWELLGKSPVTSSSVHMPFSLDQDGTLRLATNKLDHRVKKQYEVSVRAWDSGSPPLSADATVQIKIVEESRYPPMLFPLNSRVVSYLKPFSGGIIGKVSAVDQDPYDVLHYSILEETESDNQKYFDIDGQDGTLVALSPLDSGLYSVNVSVSDGKYRRSVEILIKVFIIDDVMVDSSVFVRIGPLDTEEFLARYKRLFLTTLSEELNINRNRIRILSVQPTILHSHNFELQNHSRNTRTIHNLHRSLDVLLLVEDENEGFVSREKLKDLLQMKAANIQSVLNLPWFSAMDSICSNEDNCSSHGECIDIIKIVDDRPSIYNTQSTTLVSPSFTQVTGCSCDQGYDGINCENLVNACGRRPCFEYEECIPSTTLSRGYSCRCPAGKAGPGCRIDLSKCKKPFCHYPLRPLSFKGKSYAQYVMKGSLESSSMQMSTFVRTRHPVGIIFFASGEVDYSILEIRDGYVQYRWDCGSGEGLVRASNLRVNDDKWHFINITQHGKVSKLIVDDSATSGAAPGVHDILNMEQGNLYVGAKVTSYAGTSASVIEYGFVGCLDLLILDGFNLPTDVTTISPSGKFSLKRLANVELNCPGKLSKPGICGSHPCLNGGTCTEERGKYICSCLSRFTGKNCEIDTAPCSSSPCLNGGKCKVVGHSFVCECPKKLSGKRCEYGVYCNPNPCENGGRCEEGVEGPVCKCQHFTGSRCEMDIDECTQSPCRNSGTCLNLYGGFRCLCVSNFAGEYCTETRDNNSRSNYLLSFHQLIFILVIILACIFIILVFFVCQRKRWRYKRHQQNNRVKLTAHHVKNDLKANDVPKRNSKICNVEADQLQQQGPLLPRPSSYTPTGTADSVFLHSLKQIRAEREALDLRHNLKPSAVVAPMTSSSPSATESSLTRKPWNHHNNLNETYFTSSKDLGPDLTQNLEDHPRAASPPTALNVSFSDNSSVPQNHQNERVYQWDDYDLRGSSPILSTFGPQVGVNKDTNKNFTMKVEKVPPEAAPLLEGNPITPSTPLLSTSDEGRLEGSRRNSYEEATNQCSFDDVLLQNNISSSDKEPPRPPLRFNIKNEEKISNVDSQFEDDLEEKIPLKQEPKSCMGSPRSRKPFVRSDFGRASDVSFLSTLEEDKNETESYL